MKPHMLGLVDPFTSFMFLSFLELNKQNHTVEIFYHAQAFNKCLIMFTVNGLTGSPPTTVYLITI